MGGERSREGGTQAAFPRVWLPATPVETRPGVLFAPAPGGSLGPVGGSGPEVHYVGVGRLLKRGRGPPNGTEGAWERAGGITHWWMFDGMSVIPQDQEPRDL